MDKQFHNPTLVNARSPKPYHLCTSDSVPPKTIKPTADFKTLIGSVGSDNIALVIQSMQELDPPPLPYRKAGMVLGQISLPYAALGRVLSGLV